MADKVPSPRPDVKSNNRNLSTVLIVAFLIMMLVAIIFGGLYTGNSPDINDVSENALREQLSKLTTEQLRAKMANRDADTSGLDKKIEELRTRLAPFDQKDEEDRKVTKLRKGGSFRLSRIWAANLLDTSGALRVITLGPR